MQSIFSLSPGVSSVVIDVCELAIVLSLCWFIGSTGLSRWLFLASLTDWRVSLRTCSLAFCGDYITFTKVNLDVSEMVNSSSKIKVLKIQVSDNSVILLLS